MKRLKEQAPQAFNLFMDKYNIYEYDTNKFHFFLPEASQSRGTRACT